MVIPSLEFTWQLLIITPVVSQSATTSMEPSLVPKLADYKTRQVEELRCTIGRVYENMDIEYHTTPTHLKLRFICHGPPPTDLAIFADSPAIHMPRTDRSGMTREAWAQIMRRRKGEERSRTGYKVLNDVRILSSEN